MERLAREREAGELGRLIYVLHWLHVIFAVFWYGSQLYLDLTIKPAIAQLSPDSAAIMQRALGTGLARRITVVTATGTVLLGALRGIAGGVLDVLGTAYGLTWLAAFAIGTVMALSIYTRGFGGRVRPPLWHGLFVVMFSLMIAMRFGY
jgi:uncharacterized membrane protein